MFMVKKGGEMEIMKETQEELDNMLVYIEMTKEQIEEHNDIEYQKYIEMRDKNV